MPSLAFFPDNNIGQEGARALAEALKDNHTLQGLNLFGLSPAHQSGVFLFAGRTEASPSKSIPLQKTQNEVSGLLNMLRLLLKKLDNRLMAFVNQKKL